MKFDINSIKPNPINSEIYSNLETEDLEISIKENGLLDPIIINKNNTIVSGHRRWQSCKKIGLKEVDVRIKEFEDETIALIELNRYRNKKASELLNEIFTLEKEYSKKIKRGRPKKGVNIDTLKGKVRDRISKLTGISTGNLSKLKFIHNNWKEIIPLIDDGKVTINQAHTEAKRRVIFNNIKVDTQTFSDTREEETTKTKVTKSFTIYNKSSTNMSEVEDETIQTIMTSPPYFNQRNYGYEGQIGLEKNIEDYIDNLMIVFNECYRVLKPNGSFFLNIGDKYLNGELMSIPHRIAIKLIDNKWVQRNCIVWKKTNPKPEAVSNRLQTSYEFIFFFTKNKTNYYFNPDIIRQPYKDKDKLGDASSPRHHSTKGKFSVSSPVFQNPLGKLPQDYFDVIETSKVSHGVGKDLGLENLEHIAVYPNEICINPILSTSKKGDLILDPFMGSGTTGEVSITLERKFVGYELNPQFCKLSDVRLSKHLMSLE